MKIIEEINNYPIGTKLALIVRHADRNKIPQGEFGNDVMLNRKGIEHSLLFGKNSAHLKINQVFSSPVPRCVQTGELILKGGDKKLNVIQTKALGNPGLHIEDDKLAGEFFLKHTFDEMYRRFMEGEEIPGVPKPNVFEERMNNYIMENTKDNGVTIFITHDSLIAFYDFCLRRKVYTKDNWVNYLSGIILKID